ncbi:MAG: Gfo/Idh/MocA family protein [Armatimonadota bacterium]
MSTRYRIGILGCGSVAKMHVEGWLAWPELAEVTALCDNNPSQIARIKGEFLDALQNAAEYTDYGELVKGPEDIVCICSYSDRHLEHAEACLAAGKHVFMEKPVGYNLEEARRFKHLVAKYPECLGGVAYSSRYNKAYMDLRALLRSGVLGEIITGEISYSHPRFGQRAAVKDATGYLKQQSDIAGGDTTVAHGKSRRRPYEDSGGNYIASSQLTHSTHPWDMARYLFGEVREVFSACVPKVTELEPDGTGAQMGILWMQSGALCHVLAGLLSIPRIGGNQHQFVQVHGTRGSAWLMRDLYEPYEYHTYYRTDGEIQTAPAVTDLPFSSHGIIIRSKNLIDAIEGKAELICSLADGARTTELLYALWMSERTQSKVMVLPGGTTG